jgi:hypothetical protein
MSSSRARLQNLGIAAALLTTLLAGTFAPQHAQPSQAQQSKRLTFLPLISGGRSGAPAPAPTPAPSPTPPIDGAGASEISGAGLLPADQAPAPPPTDQAVAGTEPTTSTEQLTTEYPLRQVTCGIQKWEESDVRTFEDTIALDVNQGVVYPGALLQGADLMRGVFKPITIPRAPGRLFLSGITKEAGGVYTATVESINGPDVQQAIQDLLPQQAVGTTARLGANWQQTYSSEHLLFELGIDGRYTSPNFKASLSTSLNLKTESNRTRLFYKFSQVFYDVIFEDPQLATSVFRDGARFQDTENQIGPGNPPLYVQKVSYGRMIILLAESAYNSTEVEATLEAAAEGQNVQGEIRSGLSYKDVMSETSIHYMVLGGSAGLAVEPLKESDPEKLFEAVRNFLSQPAAAEYSASNPGAPIAYTLRYLSTRDVARASFSTTYDRKNCTVTTIQEPTVPHKIEFRIADISRCVAGCDQMILLVNGLPIIATRANGWIELTPWLTPGVDNSVEVQYYNGNCGGRFLKLEVRQDGVFQQELVYDDYDETCLQQNTTVWSFKINPLNGYTKIDQPQ